MSTTYTGDNSDRVIREAGPTGDPAIAQKNTDALTAAARAAAAIVGTEGSTVPARVIAPAVRTPLVADSPGRILTTPL